MTLSSIMLKIAIALGGIALLGAILVVVAVMNPPKEYKGAE